MVWIVVIVAVAILMVLVFALAKTSKMSDAVDERLFQEYMERNDEYRKNHTDSFTGSIK